MAREEAKKVSFVRRSSARADMNKHRAKLVATNINVNVSLFATYWSSLDSLNYRVVLHTISIVICVSLFATNNANTGRKRVLMEG